MKRKEIAVINERILTDYLKDLILYETGYEATDEEISKILKGDKLRDWLWLCKHEPTLPRRAKKRFDRFEAEHNVRAQSKYKHDFSKDMQDWTDAEYDFLFQYIDAEQEGRIFIDRVVRDFELCEVLYGDDGKPVTIELCIEDAARENYQTHFIANIAPENGKCGCSLHYGEDRQGAMGIEWDYALPSLRPSVMRAGAKNDGWYTCNKPSAVMDTIMALYELKEVNPSLFL